MNEESVMSNASSTAKNYFLKAIEHIDFVFDEKGYAKQHPELIAAFVKACSDDYNATLNYQGLKDISQSLTAISESIDELKP